MFGDGLKRSSPIGGREPRAKRVVAGAAVNPAPFVSPAGCHLPRLGRIL